MPWSCSDIRKFPTVNYYYEQSMRCPRNISSDVLVYSASGNFESILLLQIAKKRKMKGIAVDISYLRAFFIL